MSVPVLWKDRVSTRRVLLSMRALGRNDVPPRIDIAGTIYELDFVQKHDFYAATAFYNSATGRRVVAKFGRTSDFFGIPMRWIGRLLIGREVHFYRALADLPAVPKLLGTIGDTAFIHEFIDGTTLSKKRHLTEKFFDELTELFKEIHRRDIAYVDSNKPQNFVHGYDDRPHLIDFQISWDLVGWGDNWWNRWVLRRLQKADTYHIVKQKMRFRSDLMTDAELKLMERRGLHKIHAAMIVPYKKLRRGAMSRLRRSGSVLPEGTK